MLDIVLNFHHSQFQGKLIIQTQENGEKPNCGPDSGPLCQNSGRHFFCIKLVVRFCSRLSSAGYILEIYGIVEYWPEKALFYEKRAPF